jgi:hypothetical protein
MKLEMALGLDAFDDATPVVNTAAMRWLHTSVAECKKWARQVSNLRPIGYEPTALPLSYEPLRTDLERETGFEPATACLEGRNSTTELLPHSQKLFYGCAAAFVKECT